ncbi:MAG TPA: MFS transporter [Pseudonocardiaceae bacterium]|nr:MFS transporter [Pseudonocardiaceae bacterium]
MWRDPAFRWFWAANSVSMAGKATTVVVLPILLFQLTGSASRTALLLTIQAVPYLTLGLVAAAIADRANRRMLMVGSNLVSAAALGSVPLAATLDMLSVTHVYLAALVSATVFVCFDAAYFGAVPAIVGRRHVVAANSAAESTYQIVNVVAPALAGALATVIGPAAVLWIDTGTLLISAVTLAGIRRPFGTRPAETPAGSGAARRVLTDIAEGLRYVRRHPLIWPLTIAGFGTSLTGGAVIGLLVVYGVRRLGLAEEDARIGWLYSAGAAGALLTAIALPSLARRLGAPRITLLAVAANLVFLLCLAGSVTLPMALVGMLLWQGTYSLIIVNGMALRQQLTPDRLQGRVNVTARMIAWGGQPFGAAIGGFLADHLSIQLTYLVMAIGVAISTVIVWSSALRHADADRVSLLVREADQPC